MMSNGVSWRRDRRRAWLWGSTALFGLVVPSAIAGSCASDPGAGAASGPEAPPITVATASPGSGQGVGPTVWLFQKLIAKDSGADDRFGVSVAISGDTVFVGAHHHDEE